MSTKVLIESTAIIAKFVNGQVTDRRVFIKKNDGGCDIVTLISNKWTPWPVLFLTGCGEEP